ncbi:MAG: hypothetical protein R3B89_22635 [Polyangiaceae bacterium]
MSCSLTQSLDGYEGPSEEPTPDAGADAGDAGGDAVSCGVGTKRCGLSCVAISDPDYGCTSEGCTACAVASHVEAICGASGCEPVGCEPGYASCDDDLGNGCETPLGTATDCSSCGEVCASPNGDVACDPQALRCAIQNCPAGSADCNGDPSDGCEDTLDSLEHCGACSATCPASFSCTSAGGGFQCACPNAAACDSGSVGDCVQGLCVCGGSTLCAPGQRCQADGKCGK